MYLFFQLHSYVWLVPFNYITEKNSSDQFVKDSFRIIREKKGQQLFLFFFLKEGEEIYFVCYFNSVVTVSFPANSGFIKVNVNQTGFYRVNYDLSNWYDIIAHLRSNPNSEVRL